MARESLIIEVSEKGARLVKRNLEEIGEGAKKSTTGVESLKRALIGIGGLALARQILVLADTFGALQNKLRVVTEGQAQLTDVTQKLFDISQRTRSSFESSIELYSRLALSTKELGLNQAQVIDFTETLNKAVVLSGATATEASNALIQLSQGLASGALRGDELRSVLEQLPTVADVIAKGLGVTRGQLRKLGEEGKITAEDVVRAFQSAREELGEKFAKTVPTLAQEFTKLKNAVLLAAGGANLRPLTEALAELTDLVSDPKFQEGFASFVGGVVKLATVGVKAVSTVGQIGQGLGVAFAKLRGQGADPNDPLAIAEQAIKRTQGELTQLQIQFAQGFISPETFKTEEAKLQNFLKNYQTARAAVLKELQSTPTGLPAPKADPSSLNLPAKEKPVAVVDEKTLRDQQKFIEGLRAQAGELRLQAQLGDDAAAAISRYKLGLELTANEAGPALRREATALNEEIIRLTAEIEKQEEARERLSQQQDFLDQLAEESGALEAQIGAADNAAEALRRYQLVTEASALGDADFVAQATAKIDALLAQERELERLNSIQEDAAKVIQDILTPQEEYEQQLKRLGELFAANALTADQYAKAVKGIQDELQEAIKKADPALQNLETFLTRARENAQDILAGTLADLFTEGLDDVPSKFADMLKKLAAQYLASEIFRILGQAGKSGGGGGGGFFGLLSSFFAGSFATGGQFTVPGSGGVDSQLAMMRVTPGEKVTVQTPAQAASGTGPASAAPPVVNVAPPTVVVVNSEEQARAYVSSRQGEKAVLEILRRNPDTVRGLVS